MKKTVRSTLPLGAAKSFWLMAVLTMGLAASVVSCKDDDDKNDGTSPTEAEAAGEQSSTFWNVVGQLVGADQICDDYRDKTFTPIIGTPKEGNETVREVLTNSEEAAARRFADLVTVGDGLPIAIDETTQTYTWSDPDVGTLTYNKTQDGTALATVDVNIPQVPGLRQIVYLTAEQQGRNASKTGTCFYRFGDVVSKPNADGGLDYWICVRPAFEPEDKGDSHWITVSPLPRKNQWSWTSAANHQTYVLPTKLLESTEHMQNLAEMLYAIYNPMLWRQHVDANSTVNLFGRPKGLPIFHDFHSTKVKYHSVMFWQRVAAAWKEKEVEQTVFGLTDERLKSLVTAGDLYLLANGYSWLSGSAPTLYQYRYSSNDQKSTEMNMHRMEYTKVKKNVIDPAIPLDVSKLNARQPYLVSQPFFGDDKPRFIVRFASGKELMGRQPGLYQSMEGVGGIKDFYVYNRHYNISSGANTPTEVLEEFEGEAHYKLFDVYKDEDGNRWFPIYIAGRSERSIDGNYQLDRSSYTYLISFEGLKYSSDGQRAVNLPTRDLAAKGMTWIWTLFNNSMILEDKLLDDGSASSMVISHLRNNAGFDPRFMVKTVLPPDGEFKNMENHAPMIATVGYNDDADTNPQQPGVQKLIRWIDYPSDDAQRYPTIYIWAHYPSKDNVLRPDKPEIFTGNVIYLGDMARQDIVNAYADDPYVRSKVSSGKYLSMPAANITEPRTETDEGSLKAANYAFNLDRWSRFEQPLDLWREPVMLFRITRVYDHGDDYETTTEDGHKLKLYRQAEWNTIPYDPNDPETNPVIHFINGLYGYWAFFLDRMYYEGQPYTPTLWYQDVIKR